SMREAQSEATVLASRLRALHEPNSELRKDLSAVISPGSPLPRINASLKLTIVLIMAAAGLVLVIACANAAGLQLARGAARGVSGGRGPPPASRSSACGSRSARADRVWFAS